MPHGLQMVQFELPRVIHPLVPFTFGVFFRVSFLCMQEKGNAACGSLIKWKSILQKGVSWTANCPIWMPQGQLDSNSVFLNSLTRVTRTERGTLCPMTRLTSYELIMPLYCSLGMKPSELLFNFEQPQHCSVFRKYSLRKCQASWQLCTIQHKSWTESSLDIYRICQELNLQPNKIPRVPHFVTFSPLSSVVATERWRLR